MALTDDDLTFALTPEADVKGVQDYLTKIQGMADVTGSAISKALSSGMSVDADKVRSSTLEGINAELEKQYQTLEKLAALEDPKFLEERLQKEKELAKVKEDIAKKEADYADKRDAALGKSKLSLKSILEGFKDGGISGGLKAIFNSVDIKKLIAGALGSFNAGGGAAGVTGSVVGGIAGANAQNQAQQQQRQEQEDDSRSARRFAIRQAANFSRANRSAAMPEAAGAEGSAATAGGVGQEVGSAAGAAAGGMESAGGAAMGMGMEAAMGPIGLAVLAVQAVVKVTGQLAAAPFSIINSGLATMGTALGDLRGELGPVGAGLNLLSTGIGAIGGAVEKIPLVGELVGPMISQIAMIPNALKGILETLVGFASKAAPGRTHMLQMAVDDVQAVIGTSFLPVVDMIRDGVRAIGDVLASILPNASEAESAFADTKAALKEIFDELRNLAREVGPEIRSGLIVALKFLGEIIVDTTRFIVAAVREIVDAFDIVHDVNAPQRSSVGAAARQASFNSVESYQQQLQQAAYSAGGSNPTQNDVPRLMGESVDVLRNIREILREIQTGNVERLANRVVESPSPLPLVGVAAFSPAVAAYLATRRYITG